MLPHQKKKKKFEAIEANIIRKYEKKLKKYKNSTISKAKHTSVTLYLQIQFKNAVDLIKSDCKRKGKKILNETKKK